MSMQEVNKVSQLRTPTMDKPTELMPTPYLADEKQFHRVAHHLLDAISRPPVTHQLVDIYNLLLKKQCQLWAATNSAVITIIQENPIGIFVTIWLAGGNLKECLAIEESITQWAKAMNAHSILICGRKGWVRKLKGYEQIDTLMEKKL